MFEVLKHRPQYADVAERQTRWFQVPVLRDVWVQIPSSAPVTEIFSRSFLFCAEQDMPTTARVVDLSSGFEGSTVKSHSRHFACGYSARLLLAWWTSHRTNSHLDCFCSLTSCATGRC